MSIGIEKLAGEVGALPLGGPRSSADEPAASDGSGAMPQHPPGGAEPAVARGTNGATPTPADAARFVGRLELWEDLLSLIVDPQSPRVREPDRKRGMLSYLLERSGLDESAFWKLGRAQRGRLFLSRYSRVSREIPQLEITSFDLDKTLKERFRQEPLTLGAAWHYGFWRSYFSHAAITHPANDGLREEFSTAWDLTRKKPAVLFRTGEGQTQTPLRSIRLDLPMLVGPLPYTDGRTMERAYLEAIAAANPDQDLHTRSLLVVDADRYLEHRDALEAHAMHLMVRLGAGHAARLGQDHAEGEALRTLLRASRIVELEWSPGLAEQVRQVMALNPELLFSVFIRYGDFAGDDFWSALEGAVGLDGVALIHYHSGHEKSYRLTPRIDAFLKSRLIRARVQLVTAGGDTDTMSSAAAVYEAVLLGANGGAMTHLAGLALCPELVDVYHGAAPEPVLESLADREPKALCEQARNSLTCWQHSILDFLSCMGIDDVQKTSGNTMAITMTEDWVREVDALATAEFGALNRDLNRRRIEAEPVPPVVRKTYRVSSLLEALRPDLPLVHAARILAQQTASYHLMNSNRNLNADFLESIYRMAAGWMPREEDFFIAGDMGPLSLDGIGLKLSRESLRWSLERLHRDPGLLDYISLAVPRGFLRPGAVAPQAGVTLHAGDTGSPLASFTADRRGGFEVGIEESAELSRSLGGTDSLWLAAREEARDEAEPGVERRIELVSAGHRARGRTVLRASRDGSVTLRRLPHGGLRLSGFGFREPVWHGPVSHASISLGAASEDFLVARIEGNAGLAMTSSGEGGPVRVASEEDMAWESLQAASGHFGIRAADLRRVRDVEIKINQGAKPGKGGRLSGAKVTATVSRARNIPVGTDALSPDPKHDIYSIEDMPAEVWLWLLYHNHCGIKITGSNYTKYVAAGMWSNFVVDYLLVDSGLGGSGNYHADSSHVGWPDIFRTILHTHHALVNEKVDLDRSGVLKPIRDLNGAPFGAGGGTRLFASGGLRGELDMLKVMIAGADGLVEASIGKAVAFGCNQCGNCHLDCPRGGITTKHELTLQNDRHLMRQRFRNWTVLNLAKLAVLIDALNRESGALDERGGIAAPERLIDDIRSLRGRVDLLVMPAHPEREGSAPRDGRTAEAEHDSCRVGSLAVSEPVTVDAIWEAASRSFNGGNNRGGGIDFAGFAPRAVAERTCVILNTIGPDRVATVPQMLSHFGGCRFFDAAGVEHSLGGVTRRLDEFRVPVRERYAGEEGWRATDLRENPGDFHLFFVDLKAEVLKRYGRTLVESPHWLQRRTKYGDIPNSVLIRSLDNLEAAIEQGAEQAASLAGGAALAERLQGFIADVREEYFTVLTHLLDSRYYRTHAPALEWSAAKTPAGKYAAKRRGFVVSIGEDLGAIKISGWTHTIPEYFDFGRFWARYPGARESGGVEVTIRGRTLRTTALHARVWGMHHRYPTNSPAIDAEGRGNPAGAHPFKAYNLLLMHNGEQVGVDSTSPFLNEFGYVHADRSMGEGAEHYHGDSVFERKALTDTEYAAYLVDFTRRVLGLDTEEASQIISPITGLDLAATDPERREKLKLLMTNYVQLTPTGPYKFTIVESRRRGSPGAGDGPGRVVGFRENMDIKFLRPHEIVASVDAGLGGVHAVANGSEAKIADSMLRVLHQQGVLGDAATDLRFNMRPGGNRERREHGGVIEVFTSSAGGPLELRNRFGELVPVDRAGHKVDLTVALADAIAKADPDWRRLVGERLEQLGRVLAGAAGATVPGAAAASGRIFGPGDALPAAAEELIEATLDRVKTLSFEDYRFLAEHALPEFADAGTAPRAAALRILTELRKRLTFRDLGGKSLSSMEYLTDGGRARPVDDASTPEVAPSLRRGPAEGGIYRVLDRVPLLHEAWAHDGGDRGTYARLTLETRDDLAPPKDAARDMLVIDFAGFVGESFQLDSASRIVSEAVRLGWRNLIGYDFIGGPRHLGTNLSQADGDSASGVVIEVYGREFGDFWGALLEGAELWTYGQGQSHWGLKADSGYLFILQDALNTCTYAAHGGTVSLWDSGSRFAVAGQNKVYLADGKALAPGFKSIHFGSPNEYAFEYLMSGGENSLHVVMGFRKPDARGELALRWKPYSGKFFMSGAAAGRVFVFDPLVRLDPAQYRGNVLSAIGPEEWSEELAPFIGREANRRGVPIRIQGEHITVRLEGEWRRWRYDEAFAKLIPIKVAKAAQEQGIVAPQLVQIVGE
ncbi:MAG TPA: glutamate synthase-related protein [Candidatus Eisenbacteria bacterium]|jgi:glutamate synthase domain-containing protein 2